MNGQRTVRLNDVSILKRVWEEWVALTPPQNRQIEKAVFQKFIKENAMAIKAQTVERDECGFWTHPDLPEWDEGTTGAEIDAWFSERRIGSQLVYLENENETLSEQWFNGEITDCSAWQPSLDRPGAFLLLIHDTEDWGPVALFAFPLELTTTDL